MRNVLTAFLAVLLLGVPNAHAQTPANTSAYPSVNQMPPSRDTPAMTTDERSQLKKDLSAARDRQVGAAKAKDINTKMFNVQFRLCNVTFIISQHIPGQVPLQPRPSVLPPCGHSRYPHLTVV